MNEPAISVWPTYQPKHRIRLVTAGSLFDGHDASINIIRRLLQAGGAEVIHLGHNHAVAEIVKAALDERVQGVCISSYQGGHNEFFRYTVDQLREAGAAHVKVFGGGGGTILPSEIAELERYGVCRIYSPADGQNLGLAGIIDDVLRRCDYDILETIDSKALDCAAYLSIAEAAEAAPKDLKAALEAHLNGVSPAIPRPLVVGITGPGGAGKSSLTDELIVRLRRHFPERGIGVLCFDPSKRKTGGALLADRIRMNFIDGNVFVRSMATRDSGLELSPAAGAALEVMKHTGFDLVLLETAGIGQSASAVTDLCDVSMYVMTSEFGAPIQLEKIEMLDHADFVVINKYERRGSEDAFRDVREQIRRSRRLSPSVDRESLMVFGTIASRFNDVGVTALFENLVAHIDRMDSQRSWGLGHEPTPVRASPRHDPLIPAERQQYLGEIANCLSEFKRQGSEAYDIVCDLYGLNRVLRRMGIDVPDRPHEPLRDLPEDSEPIRGLNHAYHRTFACLDDRSRQIFLSMTDHLDALRGREYVFRVRDRDIAQSLVTQSLAGLEVPKVALPPADNWPSLFRYVYFENVPGFFPYTSGVFPLRRQDEDPTRMFAGEGPPARTNARFHYLSRGQPACRLSTAFDSLTLYGQDPHERPDIYGKIGEGGVSICTVDDVERLYAGFDLLDPNTSVSMTINGPASIMLAYFMNAAIRQACRRYLFDAGRLAIDEDRIYWPDSDGRTWQDTRSLLTDAEYEVCKARALSTVRGTVQADILKEEQAQNTCIFSLEFALRMMGDVQEHFIKHDVRNFYSVSVSGYHIAEAGANPITQLAFTLANGFTYVEAYRTRSMDVDEFAPNMSFFFSTGLDPEYAVLGRVARRVWAVAMRDVYGATEKSHKLKYHVQTSGRSLHAQEIAFNDIRTTLQALMAYQDNCNSLHTNAYDEAITTPTEESARRALAIQLIISKELGHTKNENTLQGSYFIDWLTDAVENAVIEEFRLLSNRGGVLGAIETQYQRSRIQDESLVYESKKNSGELPIMGVNTFINPEPSIASEKSMSLARCTMEEKDSRLADLARFKETHASEARAAIEAIKNSALEGGNLFETLMEVAPVLTLGQITTALFEVGGKYRRSV